MRKFLKVLAFIFLAFAVIILCSGLIVLASVKDFNLDAEKLNNKSVKVDYYDDTGTVFYSEYLGGKGDFISLEKLSKNTLNAFISIEDKRFYKHNGVDFIRILGATFSNVKSMSFKEGGSTISQQLIKNTHLSNEKTLKRKFAEIKITKQLEKRYTKNEILEIYLNTIYFGKGAYGINSASKAYFNKTADKLTLNEASTLAGIIKAPSKYSPTTNYQNCLDRKNLVLKTMLDNGYISKEVYKNTIDLPIILTENTDNLHFSPYILAVKNEFENTLNNNPYLIKGNVKIYTYLSSDLQKQICDISVANLPKTDKSQIIINSKNNGVIAFYTNNSIYKRNPASCVKPWLVYAPMINDKVITESTVIKDEKVDFNGYTPNNYGGKWFGNVTVKTALSKSLNIPAVKLLNGYTLEKANEYTKKMGVDIKNGNLTYALGGIDGGMTLQQLCDCYSTFNSNGYFTSSAFIDKIYIDNLLTYNRKPINISVFSPETAYVINDILKESVISGTSKNLKGFDFDVCAKTGTNGNSNGNLDAYSISYTTNHIIGVWLGNSDGSFMPNSVSGGTYPTIFNREMLKILYKNRKPNNFIAPSGIIRSSIDEETLLKEEKTYLTTELDGALYYYIIGTEPKEFKNIENLINDDILENKITLKNGIVEILIKNDSYNKLKVVKKRKNFTKTIYNGEFLSKFSDKLVDFGEYQYTLYLTDIHDKIHVITMPKVNYTKSSLSIFDNDWWDN